MMRAIYAAAIGLGLAAFSASPALALAHETLQVHVPFAFSVADKTLPAGDYFVKPLNDQEPPILEVRSTDGRYAALSLTLSASPGARGSHPELVFEKHGSEEFLHAIRLPGVSGAVLEPSASELAARETKAVSTAVGSSVRASR
jgi:hypothetical protein